MDWHLLGRKNCSKYHSSKSFFPLMLQGKTATVYTWDRPGAEGATALFLSPCCQLLAKSQQCATQLQ